MHKKSIVILTMIAVICFLQGCAGLADILDAIGNATKQTSNSFNERYGKSPYYQGSSIEKFNNSMNTLGNISLDLADFTISFQQIITDKYGMEILVRDMATDSLIDAIYLSLHGDNKPFKQKLYADFNDALVNNVKNKLNYYKYKVEVKTLSEDMAAILKQMKQDAR